jgi:hypothetical protein
MQYLFIGGPKDGERIEVQSDLRTVRVEAPGPDGFALLAYRKEFLAEQTGSIHEVFFVDDGRGLIQTLLDGYKAA